MFKLMGEEINAILGAQTILIWITDWHHEACRVMKIGDREGLIFLSHPHTNNGFFFLLTT